MLCLQGRRNLYIHTDILLVFSLLSQPHKTDFLYFYFNRCVCFFVETFKYAKVVNLALDFQGLMLSHFR